MNKDKEIVAILIPGFPESEQDSVCLPAQQSFVLHLQKAMPEVNIVVLTFHYPFHHQPYQWNGITVIPFAGSNKGGITGYFMRRRVIGVLKQLHQHNRIKVLLSLWYGECAFVGQVFSKKSGVAHYCWIRGQDARKENPYPERLKLKAGQLIALSDFLQDEFEKNHGLRPKWLAQQGIDEKNFKEVREKDIDLLAVGSLIALKRLEIFIDVVKAVSDKKAGIRAVIIGKGSERERLEKIAEEKGLNSVIEFKGELPYPEVIQYMQRSKILLHPSSYEGFSGVCLEALAAGAQVISFCKPMKEEIVNWSIVGSTEQMIEKTIQILENPLKAGSIIPFTIGQTVIKMKGLIVENPY